MKTTVITIALAMMTVVAFGQENQQTKATDKIQTEEKAQTEDKVQTRRGPYFVDKNNNGICDNFEDGTRPRRGQGRNARGVNAKGRFFVDKDNDGICDNYQSGNRQGRGKRFGRRGQGQGRCPIFIDKN
ncbi:MAG: hypothetical protein BWX63_01695 [Bacteroidetes bacterium ADurb.Bin041]|nr:MAG: hypothetical protein BWX63_01695 [Bacteroidetes bacterium ADurb.Bin041]